MDERKAQKIFQGYYMERGATLCLSNVYLYPNESDFLAIKENGIYEVEIKVSKWDYLKDFDKDRHELLKSKRDFTKIPNFFYFGIPEDLLGKIDVPDYAGLLVIRSNGNGVIVKQRAPRLHGEDIDPSLWKRIATKLFYKYN